MQAQDFGSYASGKTRLKYNVQATKNDHILSKCTLYSLSFCFSGLVLSCHCLLLIIFFIYPFTRSCFSNPFHSLSNIFRCSIPELYLQRSDLYYFQRGKSCNIMFLSPENGSSCQWVDMNTMQIQSFHSIMNIQKRELEESEIEIKHP